MPVGRDGARRRSIRLGWQVVLLLALRRVARRFGLTRAATTVGRVSSIPTSSMRSPQLEVCWYTSRSVWNGSDWQRLPALDGFIYALVGYNGSLIAAGVFTTSDDRVLNNIARLEGSSWQPLGQGTNAGVGTCWTCVHALPCQPRTPWRAFTVDPPTMGGTIVPFGTPIDSSAGMTQARPSIEAPTSLPGPFFLPRRNPGDLHAEGALPL